MPNDKNEIQEEEFNVGSINDVSFDDLDERVELDGDKVDLDLYNSLVNKENNYDVKGIVERASEVTGEYIYNKDRGIFDKDVIKKMMAIRAYQERFMDPANPGHIKEDKADVVDDISREIGIMQAKARIQVGREKEDMAAKIMEGKEEGLEGLAGRKQESEDIASEYVMKTSDTYLKRNAALNAFDYISKHTSKEVSNNFKTNIKNATNNYLSEASDDLTADEKKKYMDKGVAKYGDSAKILGYSVNVLAKYLDQKDYILARSADRLNKVTKESTSIKEIDAISNKCINEYDKYNKLNYILTEMSKNAKGMLQELDKMNKEGHKDSKSFDNMKKSLKDLSQMDPNNMTLEKAEKLIKKVEKYTKDYNKSHERIFRRRWGFGNDRLLMSRKIIKMVNDNMDNFYREAKGLESKRKIGDCFLSAAVLIEKANKVKEARSKVTVSELKKEEGIVEKTDKTKAVSHEKDMDKNLKKAEPGKY
ncbi:MAG: hypothetical protein K6F90_01795 [Lachnospiraceae bacterium]|nr:hypothetical protein [Lachnospiraceae bacterium]